MTRINLLPPEIKEKVARPRYALWFGLMFLVVVVILAGLYFLISSQKADKDKKLKDKKNQLEVLRQQVEEPLRVYEEQEAKLKSYQDLFKQANSGRVGWASMLNDLAIYVPEGLGTASNPRAPAIWLTNLNIDATPLETATGAAAQPAGGGAPTAAPIVIKGYAAPAWLCIQTWRPRASDLKSKGFLDTYPYYYYFRGQPKVAEFFVRLHNMEEWKDIWIESSKQEQVSTTIIVMVPDPNNPALLTPEQRTYQDWAINFTIIAY